MQPDLLFDICGFERVFDIDPVRESVTLEQLQGLLTRFELKAKLKASIDREIRWIDQAEVALLAGRSPTSVTEARLQNWLRDRDLRGPDAIRNAAEQLRTDSLRSAKQDMRLWCPARFVDQGRRATESVLSLSCIVLDYDDGTPVEKALETWCNVYTILHTTWSHRPDHPKFRLVLPLLNPVRADEWPAVWKYAFDRAEGAPDPTGKSLARAYALPAIASADQPHGAYVTLGPLLDPVALDLIASPAPAPTTRQLARDSVTAPKPNAQYVDALHPELDEQSASAAAASRRPPARHGVPLGPDGGPVGPSMQSATLAVPKHNGADRDDDEWSEPDPFSSAALPGARDRRPTTASGPTQQSPAQLSPAQLSPAQLNEVMQSLQALTETVQRLEARLLVAPLNQAPVLHCDAIITKLEAHRSRGRITDDEFAATLKSLSLIEADTEP